MVKVKFEYDYGRLVDKCVRFTPPSGAKKSLSQRRIEEQTKRQFKESNKFL